MEIGEPGGFLAWLTESLDSVVGLSRELLDPDAVGTEEAAVDAVIPVVEGLLDHAGLALLKVGPDGVSFETTRCVPPADPDEIEREIRHQMAEGNFAWALYQEGPSVVPSARDGRWILLHPVATSSRVWGMLVALLYQPSSFVPDVTQKLLSLALARLAGHVQARSAESGQSGDRERWEELVEARTAALRRSEQAARAAERGKAAFLSRITHGIRTPLNGVIGMSSLLLQSELSGDQRAQAEAIQRSGQRLLALVDEILDASQAEAGRLRLDSGAFSLRDVAEGLVMARVAGAAAKGVDLMIRYGRGVPAWFTGDARRVTTILAHIVDSAVAATPAGYVLIEVGEGAEGDVQVSVSDSGRPLGEREEGDGPREPGARPADGSGSGSGAVLCRELVALMGGQLSARPQHSRGARTVLSLPLASAGGAAPRPRAAWLAGRTVAIVCDRTLLGGVTAEIVSDLGGKPLIHGTLEEARTWVSGEGERGAVLLMVGGAGVSPRLDGPWPGPTIALLTPSPSASPVDARREGFDRVGFLPVTHDRLMALWGADEASDAAASAGPGRRAGRRQSEGRGRVLLVEDDLINQRVAEMMLRRLGCDVVICDRGDDALDTVVAGGCDLVLMDCQVPGMDGYQATKAIRGWELSRDHRVPIIALTARASMEDRDAAFRAGMDDFMSKPMLIEELEWMLDEWLPLLQRDAPVGEGGEGAGPFTDAVVFDRATALRQMGGDEAIFQDVLALFRKGWMELREAMPRALARGDVESVAAAAHRLKGSAGNLGAPLAWEAASRLESLARAGHRTDLGPLWLSLDAEIGRFLEAVDRTPVPEPA